MDDGLGMNNDVNGVQGNVEQQMRLDHLERLVHQRRGIDGDDRPHPPGGMGECLFGGDSDKIGSTAAAERPPARSENEPSYFVGTSRAQTLGEGGVLGIDRNDLRSEEHTSELQ